MTRLVLGPLLRHVDRESATIWVETDRPCTVDVRTAGPPPGGGGDTGSPAPADAPGGTARTFSVHGHHYAIVEVRGLTAGADLPYEVLLDGETAWPEPGSGLPPSRIRTRPAGNRLRVSFGSCRRAPGADADHGRDVLVSYAARLASAPDDRDRWPDVLLMIGDQVYADELSDEIKAFISTRRGPEDEPRGELADFEDYTRLYALAWGENPAVRWLLSTVPTFTIFDDHDIRDDWNTSYAWREEMWSRPWWRRRIVGGLASYWIYQHLGNLSPADRAADELYAAVRAADDGGKLLDEFAEQADRRPDTARWSYAHDFDGTRIIVVDSRASRLLTRDRRAMLDDGESRWLDEQCAGGVDHLLIASSLPYLLPGPIHHAEGWNEAVAGGAWGRRAAAFGEKIRQAADLEHWAAFEASFRTVAEQIMSVAQGRRGPAPASISFLSGDIHYSYLAEVTAPAPAGATPVRQIVCSPLRNPLLGRYRWANRVACLPGVSAPFRLLARLAGVPKPPLKWRLTDGPWFDNAIATVEIDGRAAQVRWETPGDRTENGAGLTVLGRATLSAAPEAGRGTP